MIPNPTPPDHYAAPDLRPIGRLWRLITLLAILANIVLAYLSNTGAFNGQSMGEVSAKYPTLLTPAGYAFSIWGLIYLGMVAYGIWQLLPAQRKLSLPDAVAQPLTLANLGSAAWVVLFAYEQILLSLGVMLLVLVSLIVAYGRARRRVLVDAAPAWVSVPLAIYLGWISVAATINIIIGLQNVGLAFSGGIPVLLAYVLIILIVVLALIMSRAFSAIVFALTVAWALVGIWVVQLREIPELGWTALAGAVVAIVGGSAMARNGKKKAPWEIAAEAAAAAEAEIVAARLAAEKERAGE
ncbi:hypothetical protein Q5H93_19000 [Hymenobacter sp. ASUV-10]|uniref:Tryptophan-rich sensory protein n=1 Tax=Hymenobacter aranciens TaxID=3063996 RepID=A0ABT9BEZ8_9BACT|nr:hypothetical protein [Hymenobacter sp. ASUV-10]MDO7876841.1 hypothetical protein [Hymenobacter sp. ASUV-10]